MKLKENLKGGYLCTKFYYLIQKCSLDCLCNKSNTTSVSPPYLLKLELDKSI